MWIEIWCFLQAYSAAITAIATALLVIATCGLGYIARQQYTTSRAQLRAYVYTESSGITDGPTLVTAIVKSKTGCPQWNVQIKNLGATPAYDVKHWTMLDIFPVNDYRNLKVPKPDDPAIKELNPVTIGPGASTYADRTSSRVLTKDEIARLKAKPPDMLHLVVYGIITYRDAFGKKRWTEYRLGWAGNYPPPKGTRLVFLSDGNKST